MRLGEVNVRPVDLALKSTFADGIVQLLKHPGVAESVGLDARKLQEVRHTVIVGAEHFGVYVFTDGSSLDLCEAKLTEERRFEGEAEEPAQLQLVRFCF